MKKNRIALAVPVIALAAGLAACGPTSSSGSSFRGVPASGTAAIPGADKAAAVAILKQCVPYTAPGTTQLRWATDMVNDTKTHSNGSRQRLVTCIGIPPAKRQAAENALIADIEHVHWTHKASRRTFYDTTLPAWVLTWRSA